MFLTDIVASVDARAHALYGRREELERAAARQESVRSLAQALKHPQGMPLGVIAECKQKSPSKGRMTDHYDPVRQAQHYEQAGAQAISVLTEPDFFAGEMTHLTHVRERVSLPVLCKDFVRDPLQIVQARAAGADAILFIVRIISDRGRLQELWQTAQDMQIEVLVEVHAPQELEEALRLNPTIVGINNRDLDSFVTRVDFAKEMAPFVPSGVVKIAESGIVSVQDALDMKSSGYDAILVGESLMRGGTLLEELKANAVR
ncbi:MAG: indole-3-glycerol phosphate synthase TrpC [Firmicutes bacterium]|nr:indole-3-glycerol phosphate synthase TrpC [Bacillota bacterium]